MDSTSTDIPSNIKVMNSQVLVPYISKNELANAVVDEQNKETVPYSVMENIHTSNSKCIVVPETIDNGLEIQSSKLLVAKETLTQNKREDVFTKEIVSARTNSELQTSAEEYVPESDEILKPRFHNKETLTEATKRLLKPGMEY